MKSNIEAHIESLQPLLTKCKSDEAKNVAAIKAKEEREISHIKLEQFRHGIQIHGEDLKNLQRLIESKLHDQHLTLGAHRKKLDELDRKINDLTDLIKLIPGVQEELDRLDCIKKQEEEALKRDMHSILIDDLEISARSYNCLKNDCITTVGELASKTESYMRTIPNFGYKSLKELRDVLHGMGLEFAQHDE